MTVAGTGFGTIKITSRPTLVGTTPVTRKISQTDTEVVLEMPPLSNGEHNLYLFIEDNGYASDR